MTLPLSAVAATKGVRLAIIDFNMAMPLLLGFLPFFFGGPVDPVTDPGADTCPGTDKVSFDIGLSCVVPDTGESVLPPGASNFTIGLPSLPVALVASLAVLLVHGLGFIVSFFFVSSSCFPI